MNSVTHTKKGTAARIRRRQKKVLNLAIYRVDSGQTLKGWASFDPLKWVDSISPSCNDEVTNFPSQLIDGAFEDILLNSPAFSRTLVQL